MKRKNLGTLKNFLFGALLGAMITLVVGVGVLILLGIISMIVPMQEDCVALVSISGVLTTEESSPSLFSPTLTSSDDIMEMIDEAEERDEVKAVVFEINSPGGSVVASKEIYDAIKGVKKPKVVYFREMATSGAYYAGVGADYIISDPDTITGSIGVRATFSDLTGLFHKIGYNYTTFKSGEYKDMGDPNRPMTEEEKRIVQGIIDEIFQEFKEAVIENRGKKLNMTLFEDRVLDARILTGRQAKKIGLVDEIGTRKDALRKAADMANMTYENLPRVCRIKKERGFLEELLSSIGRGLEIVGRRRIVIE